MSAKLSGQRIAILELLQRSDIDPDMPVGAQTAFEVMEKWIDHAFDEIEESQETTDPPEEET